MINCSSTLANEANDAMAQQKKRKENTGMGEGGERKMGGNKKMGGAGIQKEK
jgi:hypothetical protein